MIIQIKIRIGMSPTELSGVADEIGLIVVNTRYVAQMDDDSTGLLSSLRSVRTGGTKPTVRLVK